MGRFTFGFLDQALVSLGSLVYIVAAAQSFDPTQLGEFSFLLATLLLSTSIVRSFCGENFLVSQWVDRQTSGRNMLATSVISAALLSVLFLGVSLLWASQRETFFTVAICIPVFIYADAIRYYLIGTSQDGRLLLSDALLVSLSAIAIYICANIYESPVAAFFGWASVSAVVSICTSIFCRIRPSFSSVKAWIRAHWSSGSAFTAEALIGAVLGYLIVVILAAASTVEEVAAFRTTVSIFGLTSLVINFLKTTVLREISQSPETTAPAKASGSMILISFVAVGLSAGVLVLLPKEVGTGLFGETWILISPLIAVAAVNRFAASLSSIPAVLLRSIGVTWKAARVRVWVGLVALALGPVGAFYKGAWGAFAAEAIAYAALTTELYLLYRGTLRQATKSD